MITLQKVAFQGATTQPRKPQKPPGRELTTTSHPITDKRVAPNAESLKAFFLPIPGVKKAASLHFAGGPSAGEIAGITASLSGWRENADTIGPSYLPEPDVTEALHQTATTDAEISEGIQQKLAQHKARVQNIHNLMLGKPAINAASLQADTTNFVQEFTTRLRNLNQFLKNEEVPDPTINLFNRYAAYTAPIMFSMGFPDAVAHAADVAQLTYLQAKKRHATLPEAMQALMVGWLHDPKLPGAISRSNLATHPAIASSIAQHALTQHAEVRSALNHYAQDMTPERFTEGIVEALSINNDSKWVLDNVILHKGANVPLAEPGLADRNSEGDTEETLQTIENILNARFVAPSQNGDLSYFPVSTMNRLNHIEMSTDLRGLQYNAFPDEYKLAHTREAVAKLLDGNEADQALWEETRQLIAQNPATFTANPKVRGGTLTSHHMEVEKAPLAALGLAIADPLLLSPHKVLSQPGLPTVRHRLESYVNSFDNNIRFLPQSAQADGKTWRNQVLLSMLAAADHLTGNHVMDDDTVVAALLQNEDALKEKVLAPATWQGPNGNFDATEPTSENFNKIFNALKTTYEKAVNEVLLKAPTPKPKMEEEAKMPSSCTYTLATRRNSVIQRMLNAQGTYTDRGMAIGGTHRDMAQ